MTVQPPVAAGPTSQWPERHARAASDGAGGDGTSPGGANPGSGPSAQRSSGPETSGPDVAGPEPSGAETAETSGSGGAGDDLRRHLLALGANVSVLTGLLVYFGWKRADTQSRVLGVDESLFGMSTVDYVLRSVDSLFVPLAVGAFAGLGWIWVDERIRRRLAADPHWPALAHTTRVLAFSWLLLPLLVYGAGQLWSRIGLFGYPLSYGVGVLLSVYALQLREQLAPVPGGLPRSAGGHPQTAAGRAGVSKALVGAVVVLSLFWAVTNYATYRGATLALELIEGIEELPSVVVYSPQRLAIDAPGVTERPLSGGTPGDPDPAAAAGAVPGPAAGADTSSYRYRYDGLRLLDHIGGRHFLLSDGFTRRYGVMVVLPGDGPLRFEFVADRR